MTEDMIRDFFLEDRQIGLWKIDTMSYGPIPGKGHVGILETGQTADEVAAILLCNEHALPRATRIVKAVNHHGDLAVACEQALAALLAALPHAEPVREVLTPAIERLRKTLEELNRT